MRHFTLADRLDGDGGDIGFGRVELSVMDGESADRQKAPSRSSSATGPNFQPSIRTSVVAKAKVSFRGGVSLPPWLGGGSGEAGLRESRDGHPRPG